MEVIINHDYDFNPRTRMGCDEFGPVRTSIINDISIHAPVWGATKMLDGFVHSRTISIHAPVWGATGMTEITEKITALQFQSTHPYGVRHND